MRLLRVESYAWYPLGAWIREAECSQGFGSIDHITQADKSLVAGLSETTGTAPKLDLTGMEESLYDYLQAHSERVCTFEELSH